MNFTEIMVLLWDGTVRWNKISDMKNLQTFEEFLNESQLNERYGDPIWNIHFETDPDKQEKLKIEHGARLGGVTTRQKIEDADYVLKRYRKSIGYGDGSDLGPFVPNGYAAINSRLGNGPHTKPVKQQSWNKKSYEKWIKDMASGGGADHAFDMAQNAKQEPGLIDWVRKNNLGQNPLEVIQWAIEAYA